MTHDPRPTTDHPHQYFSTSKRLITGKMNLCWLTDWNFILFWSRWTQAHVFSTNSKNHLALGRRIIVHFYIIHRWTSDLNDSHWIFLSVCMIGDLKPRLLEYSEYVQGRPYIQTDAQQARSRQVQNILTEATEKKDENPRTNIWHLNCSFNKNIPSLQNFASELSRW